MNLAYADGKIINSEDAINAFNTLSRQPLLDAIINAMWPEAKQVFSTYYGQPAIALYAYKEEGKSLIQIINSTNGTRMGDPCSIIGFDIALHRFVYRHVNSYLNMPVRALTDDMPTTDPTPDDATDDAWFEAQQGLLSEWPWATEGPSV